MTVIGIDPGLKGGIAVISDKDQSVYPMEEFASVISFMEGKVYIEKQTAVSGQAGAGKTMQNFGRLIGWIEATGHDYEIIAPRVWYKYYGIQSQLTTKARKEKTADIVGNLFPDQKANFRGPKGGLRDGLTDALAIANYGYQIEKERNESKT